jgi:hypothetical protein
MPGSPQVVYGLNAIVCRYRSHRNEDERDVGFESFAYGVKETDGLDNWVHRFKHGRNEIWNNGVHDER